MTKKTHVIPVRFNNRRKVARLSEDIECECRGILHIRATKQTIVIVLIFTVITAEPSYPNVSALNPELPLPFFDLRSCCQYSRRFRLQQKAKALMARSTPVST